MSFSLGSEMVVCLIMLCIQRVHITATVFSLTIAAVTAGRGVSCDYFSIAALARVNLSLYSVFLMLGGMLLPFLYGVLFLGESLTIGKIACVMLIVGAMALSVEREKGKRGAFKYYMAVFTLSGLASVGNKVHQVHPECNVSTADFIFLQAVIAIVISAMIIFLRSGRCGFRPLLCGKYWLSFGGYGLSYGTAQILSMTAMIVLPASVQFPLVTGGVIICSMLISVIYGERQNKKTILPMLLAVIALILMGL